MSIAEFCIRHGAGDPGSLERLANYWQQEREVDAALHSQVGTGLLLGDLLVSDGLLNQISPELRDAFSALMGEKADSYGKIRRLLLQKLKAGDASVLGLVNKMKGQVGENRLVRDLAASASARLASVGNQEGWDVAVDHVWGTQHIQVKMYSNADEVLRHMKAIDAKLSGGRVILDGEKIVKRIDFAVPENIASEVARKAEALGLDIDVIRMKTTAQNAADVVWKGVNNVGTGAFRNLVRGIIGVAAKAAAVHALTSAFLVLRGVRGKQDLLGDVAQNTSVTVAGAAAGASMEFLLYRATILGAGPAGLLVMGTSMSTISVLQRVLERTNFVEYLRENNTAIVKLTSRFSNPSNQQTGNNDNER